MVGRADLRRAGPRPGGGPRARARAAPLSRRVGRGRRAPHRPRRRSLRPTGRDRRAASRPPSSPSPSWPRCTTRPVSTASPPLVGPCRRPSRRSRCSTPRSTARCRRPPQRTAGPTSGSSAACAATGSTASATSTPPHRVAALLGRPVGALRLVTCHLGGGCSLAAVARRPERRHHDGLHAARRPGDGHPIRLGRSRARAPPPASRRHRRRGRRPAAAPLGDPRAVGRQRRSADRRGRTRCR